MTSVILHAIPHGNNIILDFILRIYQNADRMIIRAQRREKKTYSFDIINSVLVIFVLLNFTRPVSLVGHVYDQLRPSVTTAWP